MQKVSLGALHKLRKNFNNYLALKSWLDIWKAAGISWNIFVGFVLQIALKIFYGHDDDDGNDWSWWWQWWLMIMMMTPEVVHWRCQGFPHQSKAPWAGEHLPRPPDRNRCWCWCWWLWWCQKASVVSLIMIARMVIFILVRSVGNETRSWGWLLHVSPTAPPSRKSWRLLERQEDLWRGANSRCSRKHPRSRFLPPPLTSE